jgi:DNA modification methylase
MSVVTSSFGMAKRIEMWPIDRLVPYARNPRTHSDTQVVQIAASIAEFGFNAPVLVDTNDGVIAGHGRLLAAQKLGLAEVPVIVLDHLTEIQKRAYIIADNKLALNAGWDEELLAAELDQLAKENFDIELTGFSEDELEDLLPNGPGSEEPLPEPKLDHAAELREKWATERGQLWLVGKHRLLCGDSTNTDDVRRLMNGERACLFATDPPYLVAYDGTNHPHKWNDSEELKRRKNKDWSDKYTDVDSPELGEALYDAFVKVAVDIAITLDAAWYCWHASRKQNLLEAIWEKYGAFVHQQIIWAKDRPILTRSWYMWQHEPCFFGWIKGNKPKRIADDYPPTVWSFPTHAAGETTDHPTQKPVELFAIPMRQHTKKGDLCYEPFSGSGTQLVAAESLGRVCYAMEKSPPFVAVALERLSEMGLKPELSE